MNCRDALMLRSTDVAIAECDQRRMESTVMTVPLAENMVGNGKEFQTRDSNTSGKESVAPALSRRKPKKLSRSADLEIRDTADSEVCAIPDSFFLSAWRQDGLFRCGC